jgi:hypothetical protein
MIVYNNIYTHFLYIPARNLEPEDHGTQAAPEDIGFACQGVHQPRLVQLAFLTTAPMTWATGVSRVWGGLRSL